MEAKGTVLQAFCRVCERELQVGELEPLEVFACRRCLSIQTYGADNLTPNRRDPRPRRIFLAMLVLQILVGAALLARTHAAGASLDRPAFVITGGILVSILAHARIKSPPMTIGIGLLAMTCSLFGVVTTGYVTHDPGLRTEWTVLIFLSALLFCTAALVLVGETLRFARTTKA
ncbi:MAG: hypothetical protein HYY13_12540 [Nitrospirae bacterium]|nr:hypothetical protein [Nitrospirota bacterium]